MNELNGLKELSRFVMIGVLHEVLGPKLSYLIDDKFINDMKREAKKFDPGPTATIDQMLEAMTKSVKAVCAARNVEWDENEARARVDSKLPFLNSGMLN